jgi:hypothetical protein
MYEVDWSRKAEQNRFSDDKQFTLLCALVAKTSKFYNFLDFFVIPFYLQSVLAYSANCVENVYNGM